MQANAAILTAILFSCACMSSCGGGSGSTTGGGGGSQTAAPTISSNTQNNGVQNGAVIVSLASATAGATIYYTIDGSTPGTSSPQYLAPFLVASNLTVKAIAIAGGSPSTVSALSFTSTVRSGTLVWSDEFTSSSSTPAQPNPAIWTYDTGTDCCGNGELEDYCAWASYVQIAARRVPASMWPPIPVQMAFRYIVAQSPSTGVYTSARLKTQGLFSFQYGRLEVRALVPEAQGFWPAAWLLGNNIATINWPACGEQDVLERVDAAGSPDWNEGSIHGTGFTGSNGLGTQYNFPAGQTVATFTPTAWSGRRAGVVLHRWQHLRHLYPSNLSSRRASGHSMPGRATSSSESCYRRSWPGTPDVSLRSLRRCWWITCGFTKLVATRFHCGIRSGLLRQPGNPVQGFPMLPRGSGNFTCN